MTDFISVPRRNGKMQIMKFQAMRDFAKACSPMEYRRTLPTVYRGIPELEKPEPQKIDWAHPQYVESFFEDHIIDGARYLILSQSGKEG